MYLNGEPIIGPDDAGDNDISFNGVFGDFIVNISGINNTWDPLEYKRLDNLPFPQGSDDLYIFTNLGGEKSGQYWATASELRNGLQLYTRSEIQTLTQNKWVAQSEDGITYNVVFTADNNKDSIIDFDLITTGCSFVIIPSMTSTSTNTTLAIQDIPYSLRLRGTGDTNTAVVPSKANWLVANKPIRVTYDGTYWVADLMDDIPTGMTYEELPTKPVTPIADGEEIPYTWEEINAITLAGKAQEYFSLGATKLVNLSTAVLGANAATMMVIGFDQDGENTTTFQTKGTLPSSTTFGSNAVWIGSTARTRCQDFYNACEAKDFIKTVSKGTCPDHVSAKNGTATYNDETVWIPSETEMGLDNLSSLTKSNSTTSNSECTKGYNAGYSYYTSAATRIKSGMSADGSLTTIAKIYWERSRGRNYTGHACRITALGSGDTNTYNSYVFLAPAFVIGNSDAPSPSAKITQDGEDITNKLSALFSGAKIATGSYTGTGTIGADNPCSLVFDFEPFIVIIEENASSHVGSNYYNQPLVFYNVHYLKNYYSTISSGLYINMGGLIWDDIHVRFRDNQVNWYYTGSGATHTAASYGTFGTTSAWTANIKNTSGTKYNYIAIGWPYESVSKIVKLSYMYVVIPENVNTWQDYINSSECLAQFKLYTNGTDNYVYFNTGYTRCIADSNSTKVLLSSTIVDDATYSIVDA